MQLFEEWIQYPQNLGIIMYNTWTYVREFEQIMIVLKLSVQVANWFVIELFIRQSLSDFTRHSVSQLVLDFPISWSHNWVTYRLKVREFKIFIISVWLNFLKCFAIYTMCWYCLLHFHLNMKTLKYYIITFMSFLCFLKHFMLNLPVFKLYRKDW